MVQPEIQTLLGRAKVASWIIIAAIGTFALTLIGEVLEFAGVIDLMAYELSPLEMVYGIILIANTAVFIASVVAVCIWLHRAHTNLRDYGYEVEYTPGWAVGWYFIPIANLFKPFQAMRELWTASHGVGDRFGGEAPGNLGLWWGTWIVGNILGNVSMRLSLMGDGSNMQVAFALAIVSSACGIVSAWVLLQIVKAVTQAQATGLAPVDVFE